MWFRTDSVGMDVVGLDVVVLDVLGMDVVKLNVLRPDEIETGFVELDASDTERPPGRSPVTVNGSLSVNLLRG